MAAVCAALLCTPDLVPAARAASARWIATWAPSPVRAGNGDPFLTMAFPSSQARDQSIRLVVPTTSPGDAVRLHLTNRYGSRPLTLGPVRVARAGSGPALEPGTSQTATFSGRPTVTIPAGGDAVSDPLNLVVQAGTALAVSFRVVGVSGAVTWHRLANSASYVTAPGSGDRTAESSGVSYTSVGLSWFWLDGIDTRSTYPGTVVALGDSITDGYEFIQDQPAPWPALLATRLETGAADDHRAVVNAGLAGNRLTGRSSCGPCGASAVSRLGRDALGQAGVRDLIVFEGTNDLGAGSSAQAVISAITQVVTTAHQRGVRVFVATITPRADAAWTARMEANRQAVNHWIRASPMFDGVFDFDAAVRDPLDPHRLLAAFDSGDALHPNPLGLAAIAAAVDTGRFA